MPTAGQLRAARALLGWTTAELARRAGVSSRTVVRAELGDGVPQVSVPTLDRLVQALQDGGVLFQQDNTTGGLGVRLRRR